MADEKILERIRKLLALSKSSNVHEAELAMQKVNELLAQYQIEMSEVLIKEAETSKAMAGSDKEVSETYRSFVRDIARAAANIFDTSVVKTHSQAGFFFVGLKEDIAASEILFDYLFESWKSIVAHDTAEWKKETFFYTKQIPQYEVKKYKIGHGQGFSTNVLIRAQRLARERKAKVAVSTSNALVVVKQALIKDYLDAHTRPGRGRAYTQQNAGYGTGLKRGKEIPLSGALTQDKKRIEE